MEAQAPPVVLQFLLALFLLPVSFSLNQDGMALLALKAAISTDPTRSLHSWTESDTTPCHWPGIHCVRNRVSSVFLPNKNLTGYIPSELGFLNSLTRLDLAHNNFSKPIPAHLFNATKLVSIDLSHNSLSRPIPNQIKSLQNLIHLDLSSNLLNGSLPDFLLDLRGLTGVLNLSFNQFTGEIPAIYGRFQEMVSLDLRFNNLTGEIPQVGSLLNQGLHWTGPNQSLLSFSEYFRTLPIGSQIEGIGEKTDIREAKKKKLGGSDGEGGRKWRFREILRQKTKIPFNALT